MLPTANLNNHFSPFIRPPSSSCWDYLSNCVKKCFEKSLPKEERLIASSKKNLAINTSLEISAIPLPRNPNPPSSLYKLFPNHRNLVPEIEQTIQDLSEHKNTQPVLISFDAENTTVAYVLADRQGEIFVISIYEELGAGSSKKIVEVYDKNGNKSPFIAWLPKSEDLLKPNASPMENSFMKEATLSQSLTMKCSVLETPVTKKLTEKFVGVHSPRLVKIRYADPFIVLAEKATCSLENQLRSESIHGCSLRNPVKQHAHCLYKDPNTLLRLIISVLSVLKNMHMEQEKDKPLYHCDIKPENILLFITKEDKQEDLIHFKLNDFGSATRKDQPQEGYSPFFCAPERITALAAGNETLSQEAGSALDVWSAGLSFAMVLHGFACQDFPWYKNEAQLLELKEDWYMDMIREKCSHSPSSPLEIFIDPILNAMLSPDPTKRLMIKDIFKRLNSDAFMC